jgi:hypothetical protein
MSGKVYQSVGNNEAEFDQNGLLVVITRRKPSVTTKRRLCSSEHIRIQVIGTNRILPLLN